MKQIMKTDWILDVLDDLATFARQNELLIFAEQLEDARIVALTEIADALGEAQESQFR